MGQGGLPSEPVLPRTHSPRATAVTAGPWSGSCPAALGSPHFLPERASRGRGAAKRPQPWPQTPSKCWTLLSLCIAPAGCHFLVAKPRTSLSSLALRDGWGLRPVLRAKRTGEATHSICQRTLSPTPWRQAVPGSLAVNPRVCCVTWAPCLRPGPWPALHARTSCGRPPAVAARHSEKPQYHPPEP